MPISAAKKIFVLALKCWPELLYLIHPGWEANQNFLVVIFITDLYLDALSSLFLF